MGSAGSRDRTALAQAIRRRHHRCAARRAGSRGEPAGPASAGLSADPQVRARERRASTGKSAPVSAEVSSLPLPALLARVLLAFALDFEQESDVSLAICADVVRVVDEKGTSVRELPMLGGISKEAVAMAVGFLTKRGFVKVQTVGRVKMLLLTPAGVQAQGAYQRLLKVIEKRWGSRYGAKTLETSATSCNAWPEMAQRKDLRCFRDWNRIRKAGGRRCRSPIRCRIIRWCCIGADTPTAADRSGPSSDPRKNGNQRLYWQTQVHDCDSGHRRETGPPEPGV